MFGKASKGLVLAVGALFFERVVQLIVWLFLAWAAWEGLGVAHDKAGVVGHER